MGVMYKTKSFLSLTGRVIIKVVSFIVFSLLDLLDFLLCFVYKVADFYIEAEWKPCYCFSAKEAITSSGKIFVSEQGESKIVRLTSTKLHLEEISDTLYTRPSVVSEVSKFTVNELKMLKLDGTKIEMLQGKIGGQQLHPIPRWSDCNCKFCNCWSSCGKDTLFVKAEVPKGNVTIQKVRIIN